MNKNDYREYFLSIKNTIKLSNVAEENNCPKSTFSKFLNGDNSCISIERLEKFKQYIEELRFIAK